MAGNENLLTHEIMKIIYDEGAKFLYPEREDGLARIRLILGEALGELGTDLASAKTSDFRKLYHRGWNDLVDELVPYEAQDRVTERFVSSYSE